MESSIKQSRLEKKVNRIVLMIFAMQGILCLMLSIFATAWHSQHADDHIYIGQDDDN